MYWLQRHATSILYATFALAVTIMIFCIFIFYYYAIIELNLLKESNMHPQYITEYSLMFCVFFGTANALTIFRLFGLSLITILAHALIHLTIAGCLIAYLVLFDVVNPVYSFYQSYSIQIYVIIIIYVLQCLIALDLIIFKPGKTVLEREIRSGIHAFLGVITFVVMFWNMMLVISMLCINPRHNRYSKSADEALQYSDLLSQPSILIVLVAIYMLLILFILLTPFFRFDIRECSAEDKLNTIDSDSDEFCAEYCMPVKCTEDEKEPMIVRRDVTVLNARHVLGGRQRSVPQDLSMSQMKNKLNEVWQTEEVSSQLSYDGNTCSELTLQLSKIPPIKREGEIGRRRPNSLECPADEMEESEFDFSSPCKSLNRSQKQNLKRSCSFGHFSITSYDDNNVFGSAFQNDRKGRSQIQLALSMHEGIDPDELCSYTQSRSSDNNDLPYEISSNASQMHIAITQAPHPKSVERNPVKERNKSPSVKKSPPKIEPNRVEEFDKSPKYQRDKKPASSGKRASPPQTPKEERRGVRDTNKTSDQKREEKPSPGGRYSTPTQLNKEKPKSADQRAKKSTSFGKCSTISLETEIVQLEEWIDENRSKSSKDKRNQKCESFKKSPVFLQSDNVKSISKDKSVKKSKALEKCTAKAQLNKESCRKPENEEDCYKSSKEKRLKKLTSCEKDPTAEVEPKKADDSCKITKDQRLKLSESFLKASSVAQMDAEERRKEHVKKCASCAQCSPYAQSNKEGRKGVEDYIKILKDHRIKQCVSCGKCCPSVQSDRQGKDGAEDLSKLLRDKCVKKSASCAKCSSALEEEDWRENDCRKDARDKLVRKYATCMAQAITTQPNEEECDREEDSIKICVSCTNKRVMKCPSCGTDITQEENKRSSISPCKKKKSSQGKYPDSEECEREEVSYKTSRYKQIKKFDEEEDCRTTLRRAKKYPACTKYSATKLSNQEDCQDDDDEREIPKCKIIKKCESCGNFSISSKFAKEDRKKKKFCKSLKDKCECCSKSPTSTRLDKNPQKMTASVGKHSSPKESKEGECEEDEEDNLDSKAAREKRSMKCGTSLKISPLKTKCTKKVLKGRDSHDGPVTAPEEAATPKNTETGKKMSELLPEQGKVKQSRYFSGRFGAYSPHKVSEDSNFNRQSALFKESKTARPSSESVSTQSQTECPERRISFASRTGKKFQDASCSTIPKEVSAISFNYGDDSAIDETSTFRDANNNRSSTDLSPQPVHRKTVESASQYDEDPEQRENITYKTATPTSPDSLTDGATAKQQISKSASTQFPKMRTSSSQTSLSQIENIKRMSDRDQWATVPSLHGMHEVKSPQQRTSFGKSVDDTQRHVGSHFSMRGNAESSRSFYLIQSLNGSRSSMHHTNPPKETTSSSQSRTLQKSGSYSNIEESSSAKPKRNNSWPQASTWSLRSASEDRSKQQSEQTLGKDSHGSSSGKSSDSNLDAKENKE